MRDGALVADARGHGRNVRATQTMPAAEPRNTHLSTAAIIAPV